MDRFDADVMEDLMYDAAEGPALGAFDEGEEYDEYDEGDFGDEDEFLGKLLGGITSLVGGAQFDEGDEYDEYDEGDFGDTFEEVEAAGDIESMEDVVADALDAADSDEFFGKIARLAKRVGKGIGSVARVVGPIASMIPLPQAQLIGRVANVAGKLLADGADEFEAIDELVDGLDDDAIDAAAPVLAGMMLRRALPSVARAPRPVRRQAVRAISGAVKKAVRRQGPPAARAVVRAVKATRKVVARKRIPPKAAARVATKAAQAVARRPQVVRRLSKPLVAPTQRATPRGRAAPLIARTVTPITRGIGGPIAARVCPRCGGRHLRMRGPVTITIAGR